MSKAKKNNTATHQPNVNPYEGREGLIYARVSSKRQETEGSGLQSQTGRCLSDLKTIGVPHHRTFLDSFTGGGDFMNRPAMREMLGFIDAHPYKKFVVIFDDLSRLARDVVFHIQLRDVFRSRDVVLKCLNYRFDETDEGWYSELIFSGKAELDRRQNRRQVTQKMRARLEKGYWTFGGKKGYTMVKSPLHHGKFAEPHKTEAALLKYVLEGFSTGIFVKKIDACRYLAEKKFWGKQSPEKYIDKFSILLADPFYAGFIEYPEWEVGRRKGHHEAIISLGTYELNQRRLKSEGLSKRIRVDISDDFPLRGLHICGDCKKSLTSAWSKGRKEKYAYYFCQNSSCEQKGKSIKREEMEGAFLSLLKKQELRCEVDTLLREVFDAVWNEEVGEVRKLETAKQKHRQILRVKIKEITDLVIGAKSDAAKRAYEGQLEETALELEGIISGGADELDLSETSVPYRTALEKATGLLKSPYKIWNSVDVLEKHRLYFFIFEEKLAYSKKEGYRTDNLPSAVRLFEEFVCTNSHDVEMGGIEPPCRRCSCGNLLCVEYLFSS